MPELRLDTFLLDFDSHARWGCPIIVGVAHFVASHWGYLVFRQIDKPQSIDVA